eukprot:CFRG5726T1
MEEKKVETSGTDDLDYDPGTVRTVDDPSRDDLFREKSDKDTSVGGLGYKVDKGLKKRVLKGTILHGAIGLLAYLISFAIFIPMFLHVENHYQNNVPAVQLTAARLEQRLYTETNKTDDVLQDGFATNLATVFVTAAINNLSDAAAAQQGAVALGMLAEQLPEGTIGTLYTGAKLLTALMDEDMATTTMAGQIESQVGDASEFMDSIRIAMASLASYTADKEEAAVLVPMALGSAMFASFETPAIDIVTQVSYSFLDVARDEHLDEMFLFTWTALVTTEVVVVVLSLFVFWCWNEPELSMYHRHFKPHIIIGYMLLAPIGIFYAAVPTFQITYDSDLLKDIYLVAACLTSAVALFAISAPVIWMSRSWYKDCNRSRGGVWNNYFIMAPLHIFMLALIVAFHVWCYYDSECHVYHDYIPIFLTIGVFGLEFLVYSSYVLLKMKRQDYYAGFWPSVRMITFLGITFLIGYIYTATVDSKMLTSAWIVSHLNMIALPSFIDFFLLPVIKAVGRKFNNGEPYLKDYDISTLPTEGQEVPNTGHPIVV